MKEENIRKRLDAMLGPDIDYEMVWSSIYTFQCKRMDRFREGRVIFAGDSAHQVSPFGARGANSGMQDVDNLGWKLGLVLGGKAPESLMDSYNSERLYGADENVLNSTRSTDFITPKSEISKIFRNAVLNLSEKHAFARPLVNSGRLSVPCVYDGGELNSVDALAGGPDRTRPGAPCPDAPIGDAHLLSKLGDVFVILAINTQIPAKFEEAGITTRVVSLSSDDDPSGQLAARYLGDAKSAVYLIRPDQHVAARMSDYDGGALRAALRCATGQEA
jgi:3-(3-hydroxy-phenyl)propionate hydroxylase